MWFNMHSFHCKHLVLIISKVPIKTKLIIIRQLRCLSFQRGWKVMCYHTLLTHKPKCISLFVKLKEFRRYQKRNLHISWTFHLNRNLFTFILLCEAFKTWTYPYVNFWTSKLSHIYQYKSFGYLKLTYKMVI